MGSLVEWVTGSINYTVTDDTIASYPNTVAVPTSFDFNHFGPGIKNTNVFYTIDCSTISGWPVHDPCGNDSWICHKIGVANPYGSINVK